MGKKQETIDLPTTVEQVQLLTNILSDVPWRSKLFGVDLSDKSDRFISSLRKYNDTYPTVLDFSQCNVDADISRTILNTISIISKGN